MRINGIESVNFIDLIKGEVEKTELIYFVKSLWPFITENHIVYGNEADIIPRTFKWLNPVQKKLPEYPL